MPRCFGIEHIRMKTVHMCIVILQMYKDVDCKFKFELLARRSNAVIDALGSTCFQYDFWLLIESGRVLAGVLEG